ncbi:ZIP family metal transporter [Methanobrevibacter curvatus]|nr:hypothetical protein [Methanobrevibacter curvatus]
MIPTFITVGFWGVLGSIALILGAIIGYHFNISEKIVAAITAVSAGILSSAVCFELIFESYSYGGFYPTITGFIIGVLAFTVMDYTLNHLNKKYFKNPLKNSEYYSFDYKNNHNDENAYYNKKKNSSLKKFKNKIKGFFIHKYQKPFNKYQIESMVTVSGALLDGIPESVAIGLVLIIGGPISLAMVAAVFISNTFEGILSTKNMKLSGWRKKSIFSVWIFVTIITGISAMLGYIIFSQTDHHILSFALAMAAGALISMIADVLLPESYKITHEFTGLFMALGFLLSFILSHL